MKMHPEVLKTSKLFAMEIRNGNYEITDSEFPNLTIKTEIGGNEFELTISAHLDARVSTIANLNRFSNQWSMGLNVNGGTAFYNLEITHSDGIEPLMDAINDIGRDEGLQARKNAYQIFEELEV